MISSRPSPSRREVLREITQRALVANELLPPPSAEPTPSPSPTSAQAWEVLIGFAGGVRGSVADFTGDAVLTGNLLYLIASVGYCWANYSRGFIDTHTSFTSGWYIALALAFVVDALLYLHSWHGAWPHPGRVALWAEYINIIASVGYTVTACAYIYETSEAFVLGVIITEAVFVAMFVADAIMYTYAWLSTVPPRVKSRGCTPRDLDCWGNVLNLAPATLYLFASIVGIWTHTTQVHEYLAGALAAGDPADISPGGHYPALRAMSRINVWADALYLLDAVVLCAAWWRDLRLEQAPHRSRVHIALHAGKERADPEEKEGEWLSRADLAPASRQPLRLQRQRARSGGSLDAPLLATEAAAPHDDDESPKSTLLGGPGALPSAAVHSVGEVGDGAEAPHARLSVSSADVETSSLAQDALEGGRGLEEEAFDAWAGCCRRAAEGGED